MTMELLSSDNSLTKLQAWPKLHSRCVKALQWWQWQVINTDEKLCSKIFLINISKVFAHFLSNHTFLITQRESLITKRFHFSCKGKGVAADSPLHRCVLVPAGVSQSSAFPSCIDWKQLVCTVGHSHPWDISLYQWKWCWYGYRLGGFNLFQEPKIPLQPECLKSYYTCVQKR